MIIKLLTLFTISFFSISAFSQDEYHILSDKKKIIQNVSQRIIRKIEFRSYPSQLVARVILKGTREEALYRGFRILAGYIRGENASDESIAMTSPVLQQQINEDQWIVDFIMPKEWKKHTLPKPNNEAISIATRYQQTKSAIRFSGAWTDGNFNKHQKKLEQYLQDGEYSYQTHYPVLAYYNSPFQPWFLRRNEVMYIITK